MTFEVGQLEASSEHLLADLIELIVSINLDGRTRYRIDDIESIVRGQPDFAENQPRDLRASIANAWPQLEFRAGKLGSSYPFLVRKGAIQGRKSLPPSARIYRFLLVCSRLRSFNRQRRAAWAGYFPLLAKEALLALMPQWAVARVFDANSEDRQTYFGTDLRKALLVLGTDLAVSFVNKEECARHDASGDAKIDLVAIASFEDSAAGAHAILGQCAARETEWPSKRLEAHPVGLRAIFSFLNDPINAVFIPVLFRDTNGNWLMQTPASGCVLVDRQRILYLLSKRGGLPKLVGTPWFLTFEQEFAAVIQAIDTKAA